MLTDDYLMRQIQMLEQLAVRLVGATPADMEDAQADLDAAYGDLLGVDARLAARMDAESLVGLLQDPSQTRPLALLLLAHGDVERLRGEEPRALALYSRARSLLERHDAGEGDAEAVEELRAELERRLASGA